MRVAGKRSVKPNILSILDRVATLSPEEKLYVLGSMGFVAMGSDHQSDCEYVFDAGYRCNCVPPATSWFAPQDVQEFMHETWEDRLEAAKKPRPIYESER